MRSILFTLPLVLAACVLSAPLESKWAPGGKFKYTIHKSCNSTETALLREALDEAETLAAHARDHILRFGNSSSFYTKYFGNANTAEPAGWFHKIVNADKTSVLFRCDDIDGNCHQDGWAGHWRGENATNENVICELSFTSRWPLAGLCGYGYTVAEGPTNAYFASDLLHRIYHTAKIGEGVVGHYADSYEDVLKLAIDKPEESVRNAHTLQYFALDVYAFDIAVPGRGCTSKDSHDDDHDDGHGSGSASAPSVPTTTATTTSASSSVTPSATPTATVPPGCHAHDDGEIHCPSETTSTATPTTTEDPSCHTHSDGEIHCGSYKRQDDCHVHEDGTIHCGEHKRQDDCHVHEDGTVHCGEHKRQDDCHVDPDGSIHCGEHKRQDDCHVHEDGTVHCGED